MNDSIPSRHRERRASPRRVRTAAALFATTVVVLGLAACSGGASGPGVASSGSTTTTQPASSSNSSRHMGGASTEQLLVYAQCMHTHGEPNYPEPDSTGDISKQQIVALGPHTPTFEAASTACMHLLPNGGNGPTAAQIQQEWTQDRAFTQCMRSHGVTNAPEPVADRDGQPVYDLQGTGIDPNNPQIRAKAQQCQSQLHMSQLPSVSAS
jgi:hypothetical protein